MAAVGAIESIQHTLRSEVEVDNTVLYGFVSTLDRDAGEPKGTVKVRAFIKGRNRPVSVILNEDEYNVAAEANILRVRVIVTGALVTASNGTLAMQRVDSFRIDNYLPFHVSDEWASEQG